MVGALLRILALIRKELLAIFKDPRGRLTLIGPPVAQTLLFGYAATFDLNDIPYAVLDQDRSAASQELLARLDGSGVFHRVENLHRYDDIQAFIDARRAVLVVQIGQDFERRLQSDTSAEVQVIADGRNSNTAAIALGYFGTIVEAFNARWAEENELPASPIRLVARAWYNPNLETRWNMIPSLIGTLSMLQTVLLTAMSVAREREQGTFDQLLVTPFRPAEIMAGKALPSVMVGTMQATLVLLVAQFWFRIPFAGSILTLYLGLLLFLFAAVGIGLFLSSIAATMQQAMLYSLLVMLPCTMLSGLTTPITAMPVVLQYATLVNPLRYAIDIARRVYLEGATLEMLWPDFWPLAVIAVLTLGGASWMFSARLQ